MTKANNLASLLDANGDVVSSALDNVPATNDASALSTGTLPDGRFPSALPAASGVNLTALNASNLGSGTIPDARFPAALPAISGANLTNLPSSGGGISNVVEDTSPQLGANLQSNGHDIQMADGDELRIGNSDDIRIYHSTSGGGQNFIQTGTSGELYIKAGSVDIIAAGINSSAIQMTSAGEVNLLHAGGTKIQTQSDGAKVLGNFRATGQLLGTNLFGVNDTDTGIALGANGANIMQFYTANTERLRIDPNGNVGVNVTPLVEMHIKPTSGYPALALQQVGSITSGARGDFNVWDENAGTVGLLRFQSVTDSVGTELQFYTRPVGGSLREAMRLKSTGALQSAHVNPDASPTGVFTNHTSIVLADESSFSIASLGTAGGGILALYEHGSGYSAVFHLGYSQSALMSGSTSVFSATDTDGRSCVFSSGHTLTVKNRRGANITYSACLHTAGFS